MLQGFTLRTIALVMFVSSLLGAALPSFAESNQFINYQGRILRPDGQPLEGTIDFNVKIFSPGPSKCLLWSEKQTLNMAGSMGAFSLEIGKDANRIGGAPGGGATSFSQVFVNHPSMVIPSTLCNTGYASYNSNFADDRTLSVTFSDAGQEIRIVDLPIKSVPFALQAEQISGYSINYLFKIGGPGQPGDKPTSLFAKDAVDLLWEIAHNQDMKANRLKNLGAPIAGTDAATKDYVDASFATAGSTSISNVTGDANIVVGSIGTARSVSLGTTGVSAGTYGSAASTGVMVPKISIDMWGRITSATQEPIPNANSLGGFGLITVNTGGGLTLNSGTLGLNLTTLSGSNFPAQSPNVVFAGPSSGTTGAVTFRALVDADIPVLASTGKVLNSATTATPLNTNNAIIARDAVGNFTASAAFLNYLALDNGLMAGTSSSILIQAPMGAAYTIKLPGMAPTTDGDVLTFDGLGNMVWRNSSQLGMTGLELVVPSGEMNVSAPVGPGDGTLSISWKDQSARMVFAAPTGGSGAPSFRMLDPVDIPNLDAAKTTSGTFNVSRIPDLDASKITTGTLGVSRGGTGLGTAASTGQLLIGNSTGGYSQGYLQGGSGVVISNNSGSIGISFNPATAGVVTNIGAIVPNYMSVSPSAISSAGTFSFDFNSQNQNMVFAAPTGGSGAPSFRALAPSDIPNLDAAKITTGTLDVNRIPDLSAAKITSGTLATNRGGTGMDGSVATTGQIMIANGNGSFALNTITGGSGVTVNSGSGSIGISFDPSAAGVVTRVDLQTPSIFTPAGGPITNNGTLSFSLNAQGPATFFAAPTGASGTPTFRLMQPSDVPYLDTSKLITGILPVERGGSGLDASLANDGQLLIGNGTGGFSLNTLSASSGVVITNSSGSISISFNPQAASVVTVVGLTAPTSIFSVSGSAVTGVGTLGLSLNQQGAATVFAAPTGGSGAPNFRLLAPSDIPDLDTNKLTSGILDTDRGGTGLDTSAAANGQLLIGDGSGLSLGSIIGGSGVIITNNAGSIGIVFDPVSGGVVTNVGAIVPSYMSVSPSAISSRGTFQFDFNSQNQNMVFAAPTGGTGAPGFRTLDPSDIPALDASKTTSGTFNVARIPDLDTSKLTSGTLGVQRGGTGLVPTAGDANRLYGMNASGSAAEFKTMIAGSGVVITNTAGSLAITFDPQAANVVTNVGLTAPTSIFSVSGSAVTNVGTIGLSLNSQAALSVFAAPTGSSGAPSFRALTADDIQSGTLNVARIPDLDAAKIVSGTLAVGRIPDLDAAKITSGTLPISRGGTGLGQAAASGQLLIGTGTGFALNTLTAASGVVITNSSGSISIGFNPSSAGVVTNVGLTAPTSVFNVSGSAVTGVGTLGLSFNSQNTATVFAAPTGSSGAPAFRSLIASDITAGTFNVGLIPDLDASKIVSGTLAVGRIPDLDTAKLTSGTLGVQRGGTGLVPSALDANRIYGVNAAGSAAEFKSMIAGSGVVITNTAGSLAFSFDPSAAGVVTNVGATVPSYMSVSPSAISSTGTFAFDFNSQSQNMVFAAPTGGSGAPGFRTLEASDIPVLDASKITTGTLNVARIPDLDAAKITSGTLPLSRGGTGLAPGVGEANKFFAMNNAGTSAEMKSIIGGSGVTILNTAGSLSILFDASSAGVVTNVGLTAPSSIFSVTGSAVTGAGTLGLSLNSQAAMSVFAAPTGASGAPSFRALNTNDIQSGTFNVARIPDLDAAKIVSGTLAVGRIPDLDAAKITSGTLPISRGGTGLGQAAASGQLLIGTGTGFALNTLTAASGVVITNSSGSISIGFNPSSAGVVTNVGLSAPTSVFSVSGSAVTGTGTLGLSFNSQNTATVFAAPTGASGAPSFRSLIASDITAGTFNVGLIPDLDAAKIVSGTLNVGRIPNLDTAKLTSGTLPLSRGGTGLTPGAGDANRLFGMNAAGTTAEMKAIIGGSGVSIVNTAGSLAINFDASSAGVVTNVGLTAPSSIFSVTGSAVTGAGTLGLTMNSQAALSVLAAPTGASGAPTFRALTAADIQSGTLAVGRIPDLDASKITSGTLPISRGGTGLGTAASSGQLLIGNGTGFSLNTLTAASGVTITNAAGSISIGFNPSAGGVVTNVGATVPSYMSVSPSAISSTGTFAFDFNSQAAMSVFAAPTGASGAPSFRALNANDIQSGTFNVARIPDLDAAKIVSGTLAVGRIPDLDAAKITSGTLPISRGGTGLGQAAASGQLLIGTGTGFALNTLTAASGVTITNSSGSISIGFNPASGGVVTNVGLTAPTSVFNVTGSAVTGAGTLGLSFNSQNTATVFAAPTGASGAPSFRSLIASDITAGTFNVGLIPDLDAAKIVSGTLAVGRIPDLSAAKITSGTLPISRGGTGLAPVVGDANRFFAMNNAGTSAEMKSIIGGSGVSIVNTAGSLSIQFDSASAGVVTNVGLTAPSSIFTVTGSAVTGAGTLGLTMNSQAALSVLAAPTGASGAPTFRALTAADIQSGTFNVARIPDLDAAKITTGTIAASRGGTGLDGSAAASGSILVGNGAGFSLKPMVAGSGVTITNVAGSISIGFNPAAGGVVTNVGATVPSYMSVSPSAINSAGTFAFDFNSQAAMNVFAAPTGASGAPTFRALVASDIQSGTFNIARIPDLDAAKITTGTLGNNRGGTGLNTSAAANGQLLIGNGSGFALNTLTAASGVTITNSAGSISIGFNPATGGVVTNVGLTAPTSMFTVSGSAVTGAGTLGLTLNSQNTATVLAAPTGASGAPSFRSLVASDITAGTFAVGRIPDLDAAKIVSGTLDVNRIPDLSAAKITSGTLPISRGGTGLAPVVGDANRLFGMNSAGTSAEMKSIIGGSGVSIVNTAGSLSINFDSSAAGVVTNVGLTAPSSIFTVTGSAVTGAGTLGLTMNSQAAMSVLAAPTGASGAPTFRALAAQDIQSGTFNVARIPDLDTAKLTSGTLGTSRGGTGLVPVAGDANKIYAVNPTGTGAEFKSVIAGSGVTISNTSGSLVINASGLGGTVTNVGLTAPTSVFNVSGSAVTGAGTLGLSFASQSPLQVLASPTGASGVPSFRSLAAFDIPSLDTSKLTSGTLPASRGGTGLNGSAANNGQLLIGNGSGFALNTLTALSGVTITNAAGSISIGFNPATGGVVTNVGLTAPTSVFNVSGSAVTGAGTLGLTFNSQNALSVFAAPTGASGAPSFRALTAADIQSGTLPISRGGTGLAPVVGDANKFFAMNNAGTSAEMKAIIGGSGVTITNTAGSLSINFDSSAAGVVTNVGLTAPSSIFSVTGSAVTGAGTLGLTLNSQAAMSVLAAPTGASGAPTFRALAAQDIQSGTFNVARIPDLDAAKITTGTIAASRGGTGLDGSAAASGSILVGNGSGFTLKPMVAGTGVTITNVAGSLSISATGSGGTVTNVGLTAPTSVFNVSGSAVTGVGTLGLSFNSQSALQVLASPTGASGVPTFRSLAALDIPSLDTSKLTSGTLPVSRGGTGLNGSGATNGQLLIGNGTGFALGSLIGGSGVTISNNSGSIGISFNPSTSGVVTNVGLTAPTSIFSVSGSAVTGAGTLGLSLNSQNTATVLAAPTGASGAPSFRSLVASDITAGTFNVGLIPDLDASKIVSGTLNVNRIPDLSAAKITSGTLPISRGGTGLAPVVGDANKFFAMNSAGTSAEMKAIVGGSGVSIVNTAGSLSIQFDSSAAGVVTNVGLTAPSSIFSVTGSAVTGAGTLGLTLNSQAAMSVLAAPTGASGAPTFRALAAQDIQSGTFNVARIPDLDAAKITTGTIAASRGGTGLNGSTAASGSILVGNGSGFSLKPMVAGTGVTITNVAGSLSISATGSGGTVTNVGLTAPTSVFNVSGSAVTGAGTLGLSFASQSALQVLASPTGASGVPSFRSLAAFDIPSLDTSKLTSGTLPASRGGTGLNGSTAANGQLLIGNGSGFTLGNLTGGTGVTVTNNAGSINISVGSGVGTVQNVGLAAPTSVFTITNSPVTTSGTMQMNFASQLANTFFAAPTGASGTPSFRLMAAVDVPSLDTSKLTTGTLPTSRGGTGLVPVAGDANKIYAVNPTGTGAEFKTVVAGTGVTISNTSGSLVINASGSGGTVTNVGLTAPTSMFTVSGSAVTGAGTLGLSLNSQNALMVLASPTGSSGVPNFRALASFDIPNLDTSKLTSGTLPTSRGGTGLNGSAASNGQLLIGNGTGFSLGTLTGGTGVTVTNTSGSISISVGAGVGTVQNVGVTVPAYMSVAPSAITSTGTFAFGFNNQLTATVFAAPTGASGAPSFRSLIASDITAGTFATARIPDLDASKIVSGTLSAARGGIGLNGSAAASGSILVGNGAGFSLKPMVAGSGVTITNVAGSISISAPGTGGTVTNVGLTAPTSVFNVSGSSISNAGTLGLSFNSQTALQVLASPTGASGVPTFRSLAALDIPNLDTAKLTSGTLPASRGGTGLNGSSATNGQLLIGNGSGFALGNLTGGTGVTVTNTAGSINISVGAGVGTVQNVGLSAPTSVFTITNSPVTTSGTMQMNFASQLMATVFAAPTGASGTPSFRSLIASDITAGTFNIARIPDFDASKITTGTLSAARGGIGLNGSTAASGSILVGNGAGFSLKPMVAGSGVTITNVAGSISISAPGTGGTVTNVGLTAPTSMFTVSGSAISNAGTLGLSLNSQSALQVLASPTGASGVPTFRSLAALDIPNLDTAKLTSGTLPTSRGGTGLNGSVAANGQLLIGNGTGFSLRTLTAGTGVTISNTAGSINISVGGGVGTVQNVGLAAPTSVFTITNSPVTTSGTMQMSFASQLANTFFAAPTGASGTPSFRLMAAVDVPSLDTAKLTSGTLPTSRGGTGLVPSAGDANKLYAVNSTGTGAEFKAVVAGTGVTITNVAGSISISAAGSGGTVTNVGLTAPTSMFTVSGSSISGAGTLGLSLNSQNALMVLASPTGSSGVPNFRALASFDIPNLDTSKLTSGTLPTSRGGTGLNGSSASNGQLLIGNGTGFALGFLTGGTGVTITNNAGSINVSVGAGVGTVQNVGVTVPAYMSVSPSAITNSGTFAFSYNSQAAMNVFAAPTGASGAPTFRALAAQDIQSGTFATARIPDLDASKIVSGTLSAARGGIGLNGSTAASGSILVGNGAGFSLKPMVAGSGIIISNVAGSLSISAPGTGGTVTNVGMTAPTSVFSVSGSAITGSGTLGLTFNSQTALQVLASPTGASGVPTFRSLAALDIPSLDTSKLTSGTLPVSRGGTGLNGSGATNGQLLIGNGTGFALGNLTGGTGVTVTNNAGSINISVGAGVGTVQNVGLSAPTSVFTITNSPVTSTGTMQMNFASQLMATVFAAPTGASGTPSFRSLIASDITAGTFAIGRIPDLDASKITTGTLAAARGGIGLNGSTAASGSILVGNGAGFSLKPMVAGSGIIITNVAGSLSISAPGTGGTVTNVGLTAPTSMFTVSGSAISGAGTLGLALNSQSALQVLASPTGASGVPTFRSLAALDIPSLDTSKLTSGTLPVSRGGTGLNGSGAANGQLMIGNGSGFALGYLTGGTGVTITNTAGSINVSVGAGVGTVQNVGVTVPAYMSVSPSAITNSGTFAFSYNSQAAMNVFAAPTGASGAPTFRALAAQDIQSGTFAIARIPDLDASKIVSGTLAAARGGIGLNGSTAASGSILVGNGAGFSLKPMVAGSGIIITNVAGSLSISAPGTGGTVTNVGMTAPTSVFSVSGSAISGAGTLGLTFNSQTALQVLASPTGASGVPTFRSLAALDIPNLDTSKLTTGTLSTARGGIGLNGSVAANGQLLIGNGTGFTLRTLTAGTGVTINNTAGSINISVASGVGTVQNVGLAAPTSVFTITNSPVTTSGTMQMNFASQLMATVFAAPTGASGTPSFRSLIASDITAGTFAIGRIPDLDASKITTGTLAAARGGIGINGSTAASGSILVGNGAGFSLKPMVAGSGIIITNVAGSLSISAPGTGGTVTNVGLTAPTSMFTVSGSAISGAGTLGLALNSQSALQVLASPTGASGIPTFRSLAALDIPALDTSKLTSGTLPVSRGGTGLNGSGAANGQLMIGNGTGFALGYLTGGTGVTITNTAGSINVSVGAGVGTVQSVSVSVPSYMAVSPATITNSGTFAFSYNSQAAMNVFAAPTGASGAPTFRALAAQDIQSGTFAVARIPDLDASKIVSGTLAAARGGIGLNGSTAASGSILVGNGAGFSLKPMVAGSGIVISNVAGSLSISAPGTGGTVTNVGMTAPTSMFTVTGSAITGAGTFAMSLNSQSALQVLASPTGASGVPTFRGLAALDIPNLDTSKLTTGTLSAARGGIGLNGSVAANGQLLIGNGTGFSLRTLTAGTGVSISNTAGSINISVAAGVGTVQNVGLAAPTSVFTITNSPVTTSGTMQMNFASQLMATVFAAPTGASGTPSFRSLIASDITAGTFAVARIPDLDAAKITTGTLAAARGGIGLNGSTAASGSILVGNGAGFSLKPMVAGSGIIITNVAGSLSISAPGTGGTVTNVGLTAPTSIFTVTGSAITGAGTFAMTLGSQAAASVFAAPTGASGVPSFRALAMSDIQSGTLGTNRGGTGLNGSSAAAGQLMIGNGTGFTLATLTAGTGIAISNTAGSINISTSGGTGTLGFAQGGNSFATGAILGTNDAQSLAFETSNTARMTINSGGSIGIGNAAPGSILDVTGTARATVFQAGTGSLAAPSISFAGDPDSGIYSFANNNVSFVTGGVEAFGMYTGAVEFTSTIRGASGGPSITMPAATLTNPVYGFRDFGGMGMGGSPATGMLALIAGSGTRVVVANDGRVGIGTTAPSGILHLIGTTAANSAMVLPAASTALRPTGINGMLRYNTSNSKFEGFQAGVWTDLIATGAGTLGWAQGGNSFGATGVLGTNDGQALSIETAGVERIRILAAGNIGIGTTAPSGVVHVNTTNTTDSAPAYLTASALASGSSVYSIIGRSNANNDGAFIGYAHNTTQANRSFGFGHVGGAYQLTLFNGGNVGIGTGSAAPSGILHLVGTTSANSALILPSATTANRPTVGINGMMRYNSSLSKFEAYEAGAWKNMIGAGSATAAGSSNQVQYNSSGTLGASSGFTFDNATKYIEVVTVDQSGGLEVRNTSSATNQFPKVTAKNYSGSTAGYGVLSVVRARGTSAAPTALASGDIIGTVEAYGYGSTIDDWAGSIGFIAAQNFSGSARGTDLAFTTINYGTNTSGEKMRISARGNVGFNTASPQQGAIADFAGTGTFGSSILVPRDTSALRPTGINGMLRYNTTTAKFEGYQAGAWTNLGAAALTGAGTVWSYTANGIDIMPQYSGTYLKLGDTTNANPTELLHLKNGNVYIEGTNQNIQFVDGGVRRYYQQSGFQTQMGSVDKYTFSGDNGIVVGIGNGYGTAAVALDVASYPGSNTSAIRVPRDTTAQRPAGAIGMIRYNTTLGKFEAYEGSAWTNMIGSGTTDFAQNGNSFGAAAVLGTNDAQNLNFETNNNTRMTITSAGSIGIGTTAPNYDFQIAKANVQIQMNITNTSSSGTAKYPDLSVVNYAGSVGGFPSFTLSNARGSEASPTVLAAFTNLGVIDFQASRGAAGSVGTGATIIAQSSALHTSTSTPADLIFATTTVGSITSSEKMRVNANGRVGIGTSAPTGRLHVNEPTTDGFITLSSEAANANTGMNFISRVGSTDSFAQMLIDWNGNFSFASKGGIYNMAGPGGNGGFYLNDGNGVIEDSNGDAGLSITSAATTASAGLGLHSRNGGTTLYNYITASASGDISVNARGGEVNFMNPADTVATTVIGTTGVTSNAFLYSSDRTLKKDIVDVSGLAIILQMKGHKFTWKDSNVPDVGLIAQEVEEVLPELVMTNPTTGKKSVKYGNLVAPLIEATKELYGMCKASEEQWAQLADQVKTNTRDIASVKAENEDLKQRVERLEKLVEALAKEKSK